MWHTVEAKQIMCKKNRSGRGKKLDAQLHPAVFYLQLFITDEQIYMIERRMAPAETGKISNSGETLEIEWSAHDFPEEIIPGSNNYGIYHHLEG
jgi:hypothetical protein